MPLRNLLLLVVSIAASLICYWRNDRDPYARYVASGLAAIDENALDAPPSDVLFEGAMQGLVDVLHRRGDAHSVYFDATKAGPLRNEIHQQIGGIGVRFQLKHEPALPVIVGPIEAGTPASKASLTPGDVILAINERDTTGLGKPEIQAMLAGDPGTRVKLKIQGERDSKPRVVDLTRDIIPIDSIVGDRRDGDGRWVFALKNDPRIAQIRILSFGDRTAAEFAKLLPKLLSEGVQACVIDLRDNGGGSLSSAVGICEMLLPARQTIVETRGRDDVVLQRYATKVEGKYVALPLAVIVNQNSASAAEIVAACLQDHHRAAIVGERSFGKGTVQQLLPVGNGLLKLTWARFWRPSGANIQREENSSAEGVWAVSPDAGDECKLSADEYGAWRSYRDQRDEGSDKSGDAAGYVDKPLELAVRGLVSKLQSSKP